MRSLKKVWTVYVLIGSVLGSIRLMSALTWSTWYTFASMPTINGQPISYLGTFVMSLISAALMVFAWPIAVYQWLHGAASLAEILFAPWVNATYD